ncbi:YajG family lipoprotein [Otariodibacter sp.]|uniref:YajG family lipoprotein n=1 Tax=Otariodibacter sp. TaxID=3030919 RepID=UPI00262E4FC2|nr:YajG family lipoprotein [Otariodibacter sp.]
MKLSKKLLFILSTVSLFVLAGCQSQSNTVTFVTPAPNTAFNTANQNTLVNVSTQDQRTSAEVANYTSRSENHRLSAIPDVTHLFQQAMQQNLNSKGFTVVQGAANANVITNVKKFFANVEQGNLRYKVDADIQVEVLVQATKGNFSKNFNTSRSYEGAFGADHESIQKVLNQAYTDIIQSIYNDNEISNTINQLK